MLIVHQKFRSRKTGHYNRSCHIMTHNTHETCGLIYSHKMRTVPTSCHVLLQVTSCMHHVVHTCKQAGHPYVYMACQKLLMDMPFPPAEQYLSKLTTSHFSTLNTRIANQNVLKRILIAMHNENKADCNENFRICAEEPLGPLYKR